MSLFPQVFYNTDASFTPLFRLLDDFDTYSRQGGRGGNHSRRGGHHGRTINPNFDVIENETAFELHGELGGVDKNNIQIEFTDPQTIVIRGRVEKTYTAGTPPAGLVEDAPKTSGAIEDKDHSHQATVEDADEQSEKTDTVVQPTPATSTAPTEAVEKPTGKEAEKLTYWVSERSVGSFHRSFTFPSRVDQEGVTANLNNGILTVVVPKAKKHEVRSITVN